jgi:hypothetical protein
MIDLTNELANPEQDPENDNPILLDPPVKIGYNTMKFRHLAVIAAGLEKSSRRLDTNTMPVIFAITPLVSTLITLWLN